MEVPVTGTWGLPRAVKIVKKSLSLKDYLDVGADVIADRYVKDYLKRGYLNWDTPQQSFAVMTDIKGHVVLVLMSRDMDGVTPEDSPFDIIAKYALDLLLLVELVELVEVGWLVLRSYLRKKAVGALTQKLLPKFSQSTEEEIAALMKEHPRLSRVNAERALVGPPGFGS